MQRQIHELTEQNQQIVASAEKLLAEQHEMQEQRLRNAREREELIMVRATVLACSRARAQKSRPAVS